MEMEFALPSTIDEEAIECSIQLAEEMGILFEKGGRVSYVTCICYLYTMNEYCIMEIYVQELFVLLAMACSLLTQCSLSYRYNTDKHLTQQSLSITEINYPLSQ